MCIVIWLLQPKENLSWIIRLHDSKREVNEGRKERVFIASWYEGYLPFLVGKSCRTTSKILQSSTQTGIPRKTQRPNLPSNHSQVFQSERDDVKITEGSKCPINNEVVLIWITPHPPLTLFRSRLIRPLFLFSFLYHLDQIRTRDRDISWIIVDVENLRGNYRRLVPDMRQETDDKRRKQRRRSGL